MPRDPNSIEKRISYRVPLIKGQEEERLQRTAAHWDGFSWVTGRVIVEWVSQKHGTIQVWGITREEALGVIQHALDDMEVAMDEGEVKVTESKSARYGKIGEVRAGKATVRDGPAGPPHVAHLLGQYIIQP